MNGNKDEIWEFEIAIVDLSSGRVSLARKGTPALSLEIWILS